MIYATPISDREFGYREHCSFRVDTRPVPQPRPRVLRSGRVVSNTKRVKAMKDAIARAVAMTRMPPAPGRDIPMMLEVEFGMPIQNRKLFGTFHTGRPDSDNILKALKDALVDSGVLEDDSQIVATEMVKVYAPYPGYIVARLSQLVPDQP